MSLATTPNDDDNDNNDDDRRRVPEMHLVITNISMYMQCNMYREMRYF